MSADKSEKQIGREPTRKYANEKTPASFWEEGSFRVRNSIGWVVGRSARGRVLQCGAWLRADGNWLLRGGVQTTGSASASSADRKCPTFGTESCANFARDWLRPKGWDINASRTVKNHAHVTIFFTNSTKLSSASSAVPLLLERHPRLF